MLSIANFFWIKLLLQKEILINKLTEIMYVALGLLFEILFLIINDKYTGYIEFFYHLIFPVFITATIIIKIFKNHICHRKFIYLFLLLACYYLTTFLNNVNKNYIKQLILIGNTTLKYSNKIKNYNIDKN